MGFIQHAYYVPDLQRAAMQWSRQLGAGPFYTFTHIPLSDVTYQGEPASLDHSSAYGWYGTNMVELVECHTPGPTVFSNRDYGLHHMARIADDFDSELAHLAQTMNWPTASIATTTNGMRFAFVDANADLGHFIELYENRDSLRDFYKMIEAAADNWDGVDPVRSL